MKFCSVFVFAAMVLALQYPATAFATALNGKIMLASAEDPADNPPGDDYMDDSGDNVDDDDVPVFNLPPDDSGTDSQAAVVTPAQSPYSRAHPAVEIEDGGDEDGGE